MRDCRLKSYMCQRPVQQRGTLLGAQLTPLLQTSVYPRLQKVSPDPVRGPETHTLKAFGCVEIGQSRFCTSNLTPPFCLGPEFDVYFVHHYIARHLVRGQHQYSSTFPFFCFSFKKKKTNYWLLKTWQVGHKEVGPP